MNKKTLLCLISIILFSLSLRIYGLGLNSYWIDELVSVHFASNPSWGALFWDNNPFLYHLLLKGWIFLFGNLERATRSLSVIFSVGTTTVLFCLGVRINGLIGGCLMGIFHAISLLSITYAQETRMYALFEFSTALSMFYFHKIWMSRKSNLGFILSVPLLCLSSYLSVVPLSLESAALFFLTKKKPLRRTIVVVCLLGISAALGCYFFNFSWPQLDWQKYKYNVEPASHWPGTVFWNLANKSWLVVTGYILLLAAEVYGWVKTKKGNPFGLISLSFVLVPIFLFQIESLIEHRSVFLPRYFIYLVPYLVIWISLASMGALKDKNRMIKIVTGGALGAIFLGTFLSAPLIYSIHKSPWNLAADLVSKYPGSFGLTTRTAAIKTPYFEKYGIEIEKWNPETQKIDYILEKANHFSSVWMIENYYGGIQYFERLIIRMKEHDLKTEEHTVSAGAAEPVLLLRIFRENQSTQEIR